ncbi:MAG: histidine kinase, partial [Citromicrobium sp.]
SWKKSADKVTLVWRESGVTIGGEPERKGFGSLLMTSAARQFGGSVEREFGQDGLVVTIELPYSDAPDGLATDPRAT